ncbi:hypothetical protein D3C79_859270 [compost metagenome]
MVTLGWIESTAPASRACSNCTAVHQFSPADNGTPCPRRLARVAKSSGGKIGSSSQASCSSANAGNHSRVSATLQLQFTSVANGTSKPIARRQAATSGTVTSCSLISRKPIARAFSQITGATSSSA